MSDLDQVLQDAVDRGAVPNVVAVAADRDGVVYEGAAGPRAVGADDPVTPDTHFRIMSMTKMVATVAALQLVERGALDLDAPVEEYRPEFADLQVLEGFDGETPRLRPPASRATVRQLVTHTAGLGYWFFHEGLGRWEAATGTPNVLSGSTVIFGAPLVADPGTRFEYGINTDWLGRVVEAAGGTTLDVAVKDGITGPLGMDTTSFAPSAAERADLVPVHLQAPDGSWAPSAVELALEPEYYAGGHGLHSTPRDYLRFQRMLLGDGELEGSRVLEAGTVQATFTNQIGDLDFPVDPDAGPGLDGRLHRRPGLEVGLRAAAQHRGRAGSAAGGQRRLGRAAQHALLGRPDDRGHRRGLHPVAALRRA